MLHAIVTSAALLLAAQTGAEVKAEKASEANGWLGPTRVRLDFTDRTFTELVDGLNAQQPAMLGIDPAFDRLPHDPGVPPPSGRYTIREWSPVTFWEAVERVGRATETRPVPGNLPRYRVGILLAPSSAHRGFACSDGVFRIVLTRLIYGSDFRFLPRSYDEPAPERPRTDGS